MSRDDPQFNLRVPADLKARLDHAATTNKRSMTAEVLARLEESFTSTKDVERPVAIDEHTLDLFADKVGKVLDARERKRAKSR